MTARPARASLHRNRKSRTIPRSKDRWRPQMEAWQRAQRGGRRRRPVRRASVRAAPLFLGPLHFHEHPGPPGGKETARASGGRSIREEDHLRRRGAARKKRRGLQLVLVRRLQAWPQHQEWREGLGPVRLEVPHDPRGWKSGRRGDSAATAERLRRPVGLSLEARVRDDRSQHHVGHHHRLVLAPRYHVGPWNLLVREVDQSWTLG